MPEQLAQAEQIRQPEHPGFYPDSYFIDRAKIEAEAWQLIENRDQMPVAGVNRQERRDNARTALMEALTVSGHLSRVEIEGTLAEINHQVLSRLLNGWDEKLPFHEKQRRYAELCNELFVQEVHRRIDAGELPQDIIVVELSDYPEAMGDGLAQSLGYKDKNRQGMARSHGLVKNSDKYTRVFESVSRTNGLWSSTHSFLESAGIETGGDKPADIRVLEAPLVCTQQDYVDGIVDVMRLLDMHSGAGIMYGEEGSRADEKVPYELLRQESARRELEIEQYIDDLADLEQQLDNMLRAGQITTLEQTQIFKGEVKRILNAICTHSPEYAEDTFGKAAAPYFYEASDMAALGDEQGAQALLEATEYLQETITFCGMSISVQQAQEMGLKTKTYAGHLEKSRKNWKWEQGYCRDPHGNCASKRKRTEIGPCSICRGCQAVFDKKENSFFFEVISAELKKISMENKAKKEALKQEDKLRGPTKT
ncbi:hypothetical protein KW789_02805 [Candidatus Saccharibacteria bacterium]|nr:hypothetical protein [Candidatus Saccharibacteria bacterium]